MGFALSSLSRGYRERRAQLLAKEKANEAAQRADQDAFQEKVLKSLDELTKANIANREEIAGVKSAQETLVSVGAFLRGHAEADRVRSEHQT